MALIKCYECGKDVSDKAKKCPSCGAKVIKPIGNCKQCGTTVYKAGKCPKCRAKVSKPLTLLGVLGWGIVGIFAYMVITINMNMSHSTASTADSSSESSSTLTAADKENFENAKKKLFSATENDLIRDMSNQSKDGYNGPYIVVGPTWYNVDMNTKRGFANTCNTFFMAGKNGYTTFNIYDYSDGHKVGVYDFGNLKLN